MALPPRFFAGLVVSTIIHTLVWWLSMFSFVFFLCSHRHERIRSTSNQIESFVISPESKLGSPLSSAAVALLLLLLLLLLGCMCASL